MAFREFLDGLRHGWWSITGARSMQWTTIVASFGALLGVACGLLVAAGQQGSDAPGALSRDILMWGVKALVAFSVLPFGVLVLKAADRVFGPGKGGTRRGSVSAQGDRQLAARLITDRDAMYIEHARQLGAAKKSICALGSGADVSVASWRARVAPYQDTLKKSLEGGTDVYRVQILQASPISWLEYLLGLATDPRVAPHLHLRFTEEIKGEVIQMLIVDGEEMHLLMRTNGVPEPKEFSLCIYDKATVEVMRDYFFGTLWSQADEMPIESLRSHILEERKIRTRRLRGHLGRALREADESGRTRLELRQEQLRTVVRDQSIIDEGVSAADELWRKRGKDRQAFAAAIEKWCADV